MAEWTGRANSVGHDLQLGPLLRISTTDQTYRGCGWVWHACAEHDYGNDALSQRGGYETEADAQTAATVWVRGFCEAVLADLKEAA